MGIGCTKDGVVVGELLEGLRGWRQVERGGEQPGVALPLPLGRRPVQLGGVLQAVAVLVQPQDPGEGLQDARLERQPELVPPELPDHGLEPRPPAVGLEVDEEERERLELGLVPLAEALGDLRQDGVLLR